jgi:Protein of unknown function (DUF4199)
VARIILVYGLIAGVVVIVTSLISISISEGSLLTGYLIMLAAFSLIFVGIKKYRDSELGGVIRFPTALAVGLGIAMIASVIYVLGWEVYMWRTNYAFFDTYAKGVFAAKQAAGASAADLAKLSADLAAQSKDYAKPLYRMMLTLLEILPVGILVTLISAALLRKSSFLPRR